MHRLISHSWLCFLSFLVFLNNQVFAQNGGENASAPRQLTETSPGFSKSANQIWKELILRCKRSKRRGGREVRAGCTHGPDPGFCQATVAQKAAESKKSLKKKQNSVTLRGCSILGAGAASSVRLGSVRNAAKWRQLFAGAFDSRRFHRTRARASIRARRVCLGPIFNSAHLQGTEPSLTPVKTHRKAITRVRYRLSE